MAPKYPSIPEPTIKPESLRDAVLTLKQAFEVLTGQRGNANYAALLPEDVVSLTNSVADNTADIAAVNAAKVAKGGDTMTGDLTLTSPAKVSGTAKGHLLGAATGTSAASAVAFTDANILLYTPTSTNWAGIGTDTSGNMWFKVGVTGSPVPVMYLKASDQTTNFAGTVLPTVNGTLNLGSTSFRWATVFTSDLDLNNGIGDWTIVEGEDDLFIYNNKKNKVYKFLLYEVTPETAPPKK